MIFREIEEKDEAILVDLVGMMIGDQEVEEVAREVVSDFYSDKNYLTIIVEEENQVVGYIAYKSGSLEGGNAVGEIVFLGVVPSARKSGYGNLLVKHIENIVLGKNIKKLYIKTSPKNIRAVRFWIKQGYEFEARLKDFNEDNHDAYIMGKRLV